MTSGESLGFATLMVALALVPCCSPSRPAGVPEAAVYIPLSKNGGWAHCWLDKQADVNRCRIYNSRGQRLLPPGREDDDDVWLRYRGTGVVPEEELQIDASKTGQVYVWLKNGVILLPRNYFEPAQRFIDDVMRSGGLPETASPDGPR